MRDDQHRSGLKQLPKEQLLPEIESGKVKNNAMEKVWISPTVPSKKCIENELIFICVQLETVNA